MHGSLGLARAFSPIACFTVDRQSYCSKGCAQSVSRRRGAVVGCPNSPAPLTTGHALKLRPFPHYEQGGKTEPTKLGLKFGCRERKFIFLLYPNRA